MIRILTSKIFIPISRIRTTNYDVKIFDAAYILS
jgi:hypothetical protein